MSLFKVLTCFNCFSWKNIYFVDIFSDKLYEWARQYQQHFLRNETFLKPETNALTRTRVSFVKSHGYSVIEFVNKILKLIWFSWVRSVGDKMYRISFWFQHHLSCTHAALMDLVSLFRSCEFDLIIFKYLFLSSTPACSSCFSE